MKRQQALIHGMGVLALSLALPTLSFANITNIATATYQDLAANSYSATSLQVVIVTPPVVTAPANQTLDVGVAMTAVQVSASNTPTAYSASGLPTGITISNSGSLSGTPAAGSAGAYSVTLTATNSAGPGTVTFSITVRGAANLVLTKTADVAHAVTNDIVTFTIAYQNTGAGSASSVTLTDAIPSGSTLVAGSITGGGTLAAGTITWTLPTVITGSSGSVTFKVKVN